MLSHTYTHTHVHDVTTVLLYIVSESETTGTLHLLTKSSISLLKTIDKVYQIKYTRALAS